MASLRLPPARKKYGMHWTWYIESIQRTGVWLHCAQVEKGDVIVIVPMIMSDVSLRNLGLDPNPLADIRHSQASAADQPARPFSPLLLPWIPSGDTCTLKRKHRCAVPHISFHRNYLFRFYDANHCGHHWKWARRVPWHRRAEAWYSGEEKALLWWGL